ncbi:zinc-dependent alcohol dehydrogenase [Marinivivus vitaminiproducens]|uniref:zinc-dependent alcohol dehydrogenase n=1 Tax=Marinivivus vitaminiproducens TaxID=3035935 RepID=UPI0027A855A4|nr:zinc-binding alcohol dehydrogenase [Geminicoccaceae bacterium SCSIO 64248]
MTEAVAFWLAEPGRGELRSEDLYEPGPGEVVVETVASGISRGTESLVFRGLVPPSLAETMRCPFQEGAFPAPVKYGYSAVGRVVAGDPALQGRRVFCLHPHQDRFVVPAAAVSVLPNDVPDARAVLAANLETALNGLWDAGPRIGDRIAVVGGGVVGMLAAWLAGRIAGTEVTLYDPDPAKRRLAGTLGIPAEAGPADHPPADCVLHASGSEGGLALALDLAGFEARVVELSWYGDRPVAAPLGAGFHPRRLRLISSQVGHIAGPQRARWSHARRMDLVLRLLAEPLLDHLLEPPVALKDLPETMRKIAEGASPVMCQVVTYP